MTLETFFKKFNQFADAPDSVGKLRELILELAVRGRLVVVENGTSSAEATLPGPFALPSHWYWSTLTAVAEPCGQKKPDSRFTYVDVGAIDNVRGVITDAAQQLEAADAPSRARKLVQPGSVLYATVRPYLRNIAVVEREFTPPAIVSTAFAVLHPHSTFDVHFLFLWLRSQSFQQEVSEKMKGVAYPAISDSDFWRCPVPAPPLAEQKRIVAKVDELMALCDRLEVQQQQREARHAALARAALARFADAPTPANLQLLCHPSYAVSPADLRKTILTLAAQGKLVPKDPKDEAPELAFQKLKANAVESDDDLFPAHWLRVPLGGAGKWRGGGTPSKSRPDFWKGDLPWVSPKDMKVLHISDAQDHISKAAVEGSSVQLIPAGSLLMVVRGMILARAFPVALATREVTINQDMKALLPLEPNTKEFLLVALRAFESDVLAAIERSSHGTCKLKTQFLDEFVIGIPPLAEQRRIVAKVEELMALVDQLEAQLAASRATAANLLDAVVAELTSAEHPVLARRV